MELFVVPLLAILLLYVGVAIQTFFEFLLDAQVRRANWGWGVLSLFAKSLAWPLVLFDLWAVNGMMTRAEASVYNEALAAEVSAVGMRRRELKAGSVSVGKNREKRKQRRRKRKNKR